MEVHSEAVGRGLPVPHADSLFDDGLPSEEADEYDDRDSEPEQDNKVVHGNNFRRDLSPLEHVHLSVAASKLPQELPIAEELLHNIRWLFGQTREAHDAAQLEEQAHREMVDDFRSKAVSEWRAQAQASLRHHRMGG